MTTEDIAAIIKRQITRELSGLKVEDVGTVLSVGDGIARVYGLDRALFGELIEFPHGVMGIVFNLERDSVGCVILGDDSLIKDGDQARRTEQVMEVPVGAGLVGRVVDPLARPLDGKGPISASRTRPIEIRAPGVIERQPVKVPLVTGITAIDSMIPIGRGQRELIIGDRQTGKTAIAIDTIINQKDQDCICVYVAIGQKQSTIARVVKILDDYDALSYTIVVATSASDPATLQYIAPYAATAFAEEFLWDGKDVLCVYDDLSKHAQSYRQLSLLLRRPPGREAYPGDVFYLHSRLLERSCKLSDQNGGGSITALPIIETQAGDISAYIPTNVISITDGQIYLESSLFYAGVRPAVNVGLSVSRVGGNAQSKAMRQVAGRLRLDIAQYNELAAFSQFGAELDKASTDQLNRGKRMIEILKQDQYSVLPFEQQVVTIAAGVRGHLDDIGVEDVRQFVEGLRAYIVEHSAQILAEIRERKEISAELFEKIDSTIRSFKQLRAQEES